MDLRQEKQLADLKSMREASRIQPPGSIQQGRGTPLTERERAARHFNVDVSRVTPEMIQQLPQRGTGLGNPKASRIEEQRKAMHSHLGDVRNTELEVKIKGFVDEVCKNESVEPPEIIVTKPSVVLQVADGYTRIGTYRPWEETIYLNDEALVLSDVLHELHHHIGWKREGDRVFHELNKCLKEGTPQEACPTETEAHKWAKDNLEKYFDKWIDSLGIHDTSKLLKGRIK